MKKYVLIKTGSLEKILDCFTDNEEFMDFSHELSEMLNEIIYAGTEAMLNKEDKTLVMLMALKQIFIFGVVCRNNIELIHELIQVIDYEVITQEEKDELTKDNPNTYLDGVKE